MKKCGTRIIYTHNNKNSKEKKTREKYARKLSRIFFFPSFYSFSLYILIGSGLIWLVFDVCIYHQCRLATLTITIQLKRHRNKKKNYTCGTRWTKEEKQSKVKKSSLNKKEVKICKRRRGKN